MRPTHFLLGFALFTGVISTCAAAAENSVDGATVSAQRLSSDNNSHDSLASGNDEGGASNLHTSSTSTRTTDSSHSGNSTSNADDDNTSHFGDRAANPSSHRGSLGWQSLLPGSIQ